MGRAFPLALDTVAVPPEALGENVGAVVLAVPQQRTDAAHEISWGLSA